MMAVDLLLCVATDLEGALLRERLGGTRSIGGHHSHQHRRCQRRACGHAVSRRTGAKAIVVCGVGGAYPSVRPRRGRCGVRRIGVLWQSRCDEPLWVSRHEGTRVSNRGSAGAALQRDSSPRSFRLQRARSIRVDCRVMHRHRRVPLVRSKKELAGAVESMEGAAVAHVARLHGVPVGEVRGVGNIVTDRDTRGVARQRRRGCGSGSSLDVDRPPLNFAFSSCPNDTFAFHALVHGLVPGAKASVAAY